MTGWSSPSIRPDATMGARAYPTARERSHGSGRAHLSNQREGARSERVEEGRAARTLPGSAGDEHAERFSGDRHGC